jgi:hypothetical protein
MRIFKVQLLVNGIWLQTALVPGDSAEQAKNVAIERILQLASATKASIQCDVISVEPWQHPEPTAAI